MRIAIIYAAIIFLSQAGSLCEARQILFSPNGDGIKDVAVFKLSVSNPEKISKWSFDITTREGVAIKRFGRSGPPPARLEWDGKDANNELIGDGTYLYSLSVVTITGNRQTQPPQKLVCDRQMPTAGIGSDIEIFSPNKDGVKDTCTFVLDAYDANGINSWLLRLVDKDGQVAKTFGKRGVPPASVEWDGTLYMGQDAPDGEYTFVFIVRDNAGNTFTAAEGKVSIDRAEPITTVEVKPFLFSPNGDGIKDMVKFEIKPSKIKKQIEKWSFQIKDLKGKVKFEMKDFGPPPREIPWDGVDTKGNALEDGEYKFTLRETDTAGNTATTLPKSVWVDSTPPELSAVFDTALLSPNGDGVGDSGMFAVSIKDQNPVKSYRLEIRNDVGDVRKTFEGSGAAPKTIEWAGTGKEQALLADGNYTYVLSATDEAGNRAATSPSRLKLDTTPPVVSLSVEPDLIAPGTGGARSNANFQVSVYDSSEIDIWALEITDDNGNAVRTYKGTGTPPPQFVWDGKTDKDKLLPDGIYTSAFRAKDKANMTGKTQGLPIMVEITKPLVKALAEPSNFSPNADSFYDETVFKLNARAFSKMVEWSLVISDVSGSGVRTLSGTGHPPQKLTWGGEMDNKKSALDGKYQFVFSVLDEATNKSSTPPKTIQIDTAKPVLAVSVKPVNFSPNGDGFLDEMAFALKYQDASPCRQWKVEIMDEGKKAVKTFSGSQNNPPAQLSWDGKSEQGKILPDALYTVSFRAQDIVGNKSRTADQVIKIDTTGPELRLTADIKVFSPTGVPDSATFFPVVRDASGITNWRFEIFDESGKVSFLVEGRGHIPLQMAWKGTDSKNKTLPDGPYRAELSAKDEVGNSSSSKPVPIALYSTKPVIIVQAEDEDVLSLVPEVPTREEKRGVVISLAAEILFETGKADIRQQAHSLLVETARVISRYQGRRIIVEGHTDNVPIHNEQFPSNTELSEARAKAIVDFFVSRQNMDPAGFSMKGYADTRPVATNDTPEGKQKNRRVEIVIER